MSDIVIWGAGKKAAQLINYISSFSWICKILGYDPLYIHAILDSNKDKQGKIYKGKCIYNPEQYVSRHPANLIIIAVQNSKDIIRVLEDNGIKKGKGYILLSDFDEYFLLENKIVLHLIEKVNDDHDLTFAKSRIFLEKLYCHAHEEGFDDIENIISCLDGIKNQMVILGERYCNLGKDIFVSLMMLLAKTLLLSFGESVNKINKVRVGEWFIEAIGAVSFAEALGSGYCVKGKELVDWWPEPCFDSKKEIKTIGIYYPNYFGGGIQRVISELMPIYLEHGYSVVFLTDQHESEKEFLLPKDVIRINMSDYDGLGTHAVQFAKSVRQYDIDVFCYHSYLDERMASDICLLQYLGIPVIVEAHIIFSCFFSNEWLHTFKKIYSRCDAMVTLSAIDALFWRMCDSRTIYIPNPTKLIDKKEFTRAKKENIILWMGRINQDQKGILDLPQIFYETLKRVPDARLVIAGEGSIKILNKLMDNFKVKGLSSHVDYLGYKPNVEPYLKKAKVYLMTSSYEGFPMVIAESKSHGVPLVLYDLPYLELLRDHKGYIAVPQKDTHAAAETIVRILTDDELQERLSREAVESIKEFSKIDIMGKWEEAFRMALSPRVESKQTEEEQNFKIIEEMLIEQIEKANYQRKVDV